MSQEVPGRLQTEPQMMEKVDSPQLASYYANSTDILMSVYDLVLTFGQMRSATATKVVVEQQARISMSPQHMKVLTRLLNEKLSAYEATFGTIPEQPNEQ